MTVSLKTISIVGGGIGGLCTAIALSRAGYDVEVFEQAPEIGAIGAGLTLWPNAIKALGILGLKEAVVSAGARIRRGELRDWRGRVLTDSDSAVLEARVGEPTIAIHRADLHEILVSNLPKETLRVAKRCEEISDDGERIELGFADGSHARTEFLIGADGIHSVVRSKLFPDSRPRYAGYAAFRGVVETTDETQLGVTGEGWGCGSRFGIIRIDKTRVYWFATVNASEDFKKKTIERKQFLLDTFRGWFRPIEDLIKKTPEELILLNPIHDLSPLQSWHRGRMAILGDAAHATTPNMGQGACMAIESAVVLAKHIKSESDLETALKRFEAERMSRTSWITNQSWKIGRIGQIENRFVCFLRDNAMRVLPDSVAIRQFEKAARFSL